MRRSHRWACALLRSPTLLAVSTVSETRRRRVTRQWLRIPRSPLSREGSASWLNKSQTSYLKRLRQWGIEHVYAYPGDGINGLVAAFGRADDRTAVHPDPPRGDGRVRCHRLCQVLGSGRRVHGDLRSGSDPPAQRSVRRQARPRARRRHRGSDGTQRDRRRLPAGGRPDSRCSRTWPSDYLVEVDVAAQLPNALDRAIRTAMARGHRRRSSFPPTCRKSPTKRPATSSSRCPPASTTAAGPRSPTTTAIRACR